MLEDDARVHAVLLDGDGGGMVVLYLGWVGCVRWWRVTILDLNDCEGA